MDYDIYTTIRLILISVIFFIGMKMIFRSLPEELRYGSYAVSRRVMGIAFIILPIQSWVQLLTDLRLAADYYTTAVNISGYYITAALIHISLLLLVDEKLNFRSIPFKIYMSSFFLFPIFLFLSMHYLGVEQSIITANTLLFSSIAGQFVYFYSRYNRDNKNRYYTYIREQRFHRIWINKSMYMLVILAVLACIAPHFFEYPAWLGLCFLVYVLGLYIYIFESYNRFVLLHHAVNKNRVKRNKPINPFDDIALDSQKQKTKEEKPSASEPRATLSLEVCDQITKGLDLWLEQRGYCKIGLTIESVATDISSNRTYLSAYININYGCSFKNLVTKLRLDYAKELMREDQKLTVKKVSHRTGFSSQTSFIHVFKNSEGVTPAKWRQNLENSDSV